jgi:hypothetical protein
MADLALTAARVAICFPHSSLTEIVNGRASEALTTGQAVYLVAATGRFAIADAAEASGKAQFRGIALMGAGAGGAVSILIKGMVYGFTIAALNYDAQVFLSSTPGALADAAGFNNIKAARVVPLTDNDATKVLHVEADWLNNWTAV